MAMVSFFLPVNAQNSREYIRSAIREWGECRNVAITRTNGDIALYGRNGCARSNVPSGLSDAITELNNDNEYIDDIQLTESGRWLIIFGNNGLQWSRIPYSLERKLRELMKTERLLHLLHLMMMATGLSFPLSILVLLTPTFRIGLPTDLIDLEPFGQLASQMTAW